MSSDTELARPPAGPLPTLGAAPPNTLLAWLARSDVRAILAFVAVGAALRTVLLTMPPLWTDEAFQAVVSSRPLPELLRIVSHDSAPPLSYLLVHFAMLAVPGAAGVRLVAVVAGTALIPIAAALGRRLGGAGVAVMAAAVTALLPSEVVVSRDARMYALAAALVLASLLALLRCAERPTPGRFAAWAIMATAAAYTHYFALFALAAQVAAVGVLLRPGARFWLGTLAGAAGGALLAAPWAVVALPQLLHVGAPFWVQALTTGRLELLPQQFMAGPVAGPPGTLGTVLHWLRIATLPTLAIGMFGLLRRLPREAVVAIAAGLAPLAAVAVLSVFKPVFEARYLLPLWQPLVPVLAMGLAQLPAGLLRALPLIPLAVASPALALTVPNADVPGILARLPSTYGPADEVVTSGPQQYFPILYYGDASVRERLHIAGARLRWFDGAAAIPPGVYASKLTGTGGTLYVIGTPHYTAEPPADYRLDRQTCIQSICLRVFVPEPEASR